MTEPRGEGGEKASFRLTPLTLVVLVAILAAAVLVLYPLLSDARELAKLTGCKSNLSQLSKAMITYASEYNDFFPHVTSGRTPPATVDDASRALGLLFKLEFVTSPKTLECRSSPADASKVVPGVGILNRYETSYGYDQTHSINDPADVATLADSWCPGSTTSNHFSYLLFGTSTRKWQGAFADGHVELFRDVRRGHTLPNGQLDNIYTQEPSWIDPAAPELRALDSYIMGGHHDTRP